MSNARRVLVIDDDEPRRTSTCALLEKNGYAATGVRDVRLIADWFDDPSPSVVLFDVSVPRTWREVMDRQMELRVLVDERCPIVLYGDRPSMELSELEWACRATAHIPRHPDGRYVLSLLRRLLPEERRAATTRPPQGSGPVAKAPKVLLVDDSEMTLELMQAQLEGSGYDVRIAVALGEIRSIVANWAPNVIVADVKRPDMAGDELCARIKASVRRDEVIVLLCSSLPDPELAELARISRADGYVSKTAGLTQFVEQLQQQMQRLLRGVPASYRATDGP